MSAIFKTLSPDLFPIVRGQCFIRQPGAATEQNVGSVVIEFTPKVEKTEIKTNEDPLRPIIARPTVDLQGEVKITFSQWTRTSTALALMAPSGEFFTQAAISNKTQTFAGAMDGDVLQLTDDNGVHVKNVTVTGVDVGSTALDATKYIVDAASGTVQINDASVAVETVSVTFSAAAVVTADRKALYRLLQARDIIVGVRIRQNNLMGTNYDVVIPRLNLSTGGAIKFIGDANEPEKVEVDGMVLYDSSQQPGRERGYAVEV